MTTTARDPRNGRTATTSLVDDVRRSLRTWPVFGFYVLVTLGLAGLVGLLVVLMNVALDVLPERMSRMSHFSGGSHRLHDLTFGFLFTAGIVGVLAQLRHPTKNVAGMVMALIPWAGLLGAAVLTGNAGIILSGQNSAAAMTVITALLHPAGQSFFRSFRAARASWVMLALVAVVAVPLVSFASTNIRRQRTVADDHAGMGHYGFMAALSFTVIGVGLLASLRPDGWRLPAWVTSLLPVALGVASLLYPDASSSVDQGWALAAIGWGVVFVAVAELTRSAEDETLATTPTVASPPAPRPGRPAAGTTS